MRSSSSRGTSIRHCEAERALSDKTGERERERERERRVWEKRRPSDPKRMLLLLLSWLLEPAHRLSLRMGEEDGRELEEEEEQDVRRATSIGFSFVLSWCEL